MKYNMVPLTDDELQILADWICYIRDVSKKTLSNEEIILAEKFNNSDFSL